MGHHNPQWSASFPCDADGILLRGIKGENLFQTNFMLPPIGQVILIHPGFLAAEVKVTELYLARIIVEDDATNSPNPIRLPTNEELVQVLIRPAECHLQDVMKLGNRAVASYEQATPNLRADFSYPDAQLIDLELPVSVLSILPPLLARLLILQSTILASFVFAQRRGTLCLWSESLHIEKHSS